MTTRPPLAVAKHDINAGVSGPWTIEIPLATGESLTGVTTVIAVASDGSDEPLVESVTPLVIDDISVAQITTSPNVWGVSFTLDDGTAQTYWLRVAGSRTDGVNTYGWHRTVRLVAGHN